MTHPAVHEANRTPRPRARAPRGRLALAAALALGTVAAATAQAGAASAIPADPAHHAPPAPGQILAVHAVSPTNVWGVGDYPNSNGVETALVEHFTGKGWKTLPAQIPGGAENTSLDAVSATSARNVWAAGKFMDSGGVYETLVERWKHHTWTQVPTVNPDGSHLSVLYGVDALSRKDVWAVGKYVSPRYSTVGLAEHWDGTSWTQVDVADPGGSSTVLQSIGGTSPTDLWAVGTYTDASGNTETLTEHWDGTSWTVVPSPSPSGYSLLQSVSAVSADDVWAAGFYTDDAGSTQTLLEHWDGSGWTQVDGVNPSDFNEFQSVSAVSTDDVWAIGYYAPQDTNSETLIEHWDGTSWMQVPSKDPRGNTSSYLFAASASSATNVWAAGFYESASGELPFVESWNGTKWRLSHPK